MGMEGFPADKERKLGIKKSVFLGRFCTDARLC